MAYAIRVKYSLVVYYNGSWNMSMSHLLFIGSASWACGQSRVLLRVRIYFMLPNWIGGVVLNINVILDRRRRGLGNTSYRLIIRI